MTRALLIAAFTLMTACLPASAQRIATVVGNADYERAGWDLTNPRNDAQLMSDALSAVGFETEVLVNLSEDDLQDAFIRHARKLKDAGRGSVGFFYYAGHAIQSEGINYLVPVDADARSEADIWAQAPRLGQLLDLVATAGNDVNFVVLDSCRDNPMPMTSRSGGSGLAAPSRLRGVLIAYATAPGMTASDGSGTNSPFTTALASQLVQPGLAAEAMFRRVATQVETMTGLRQQPWTESGLRGEADFCFAGCSADAPELDSVALELALKSNSTALLEAFMRSYPKAAGRGLVEARLNELESLPGPARALRVEATVSTLAGPDTMPVDIRMLRAIIQRLADSDRDVDAAVMKLIEQRNLGAAIASLQNYLSENNDTLGTQEKVTLLHQIGAFAADTEMPVARKAYEHLIDLDPGDFYAHVRLIRLARLAHDIGAARRYLARARLLSDGAAETEIFLDIQEGSIRVYEDALPGAGDLLLDAAERAEAGGYDRLESQARTNAALSFAIRGEHETARTMLNALMGWQRERGFDRDLGVALSTMGKMAELDGDLEDARGYYQAYAAHEGKTGRADAIANSLRGLASIELKLGEVEQAERHLNEALSLARQADLKVGEFFGLLGLAEVEFARGKQVDACDLVARAELLYAEEMRVSPSTLDTIEKLGCAGSILIASHSPG